MRRERGAAAINKTTMKRRPFKEKLQDGNWRLGSDNKRSESERQAELLHNRPASRKKYIYIFKNKKKKAARGNRGSY